MATQLLTQPVSTPTVLPRLLWDSTDSLTFDEVEHRYRYDGREVPSVTQILSEFGMVNDAWYREFHRWRGSVVHKCCELDDLNDLDDSSVDPRVLGHLDAYRNFRRDFQFEPVAIERRIYHPLARYAGTYDRAGVIGKHLVLLDLKSGAPAPAAALQTAAYAACFERSQLFRRIALWIKADGNYQVKEYKVQDYARDWTIFQGLAAAYWWRKENL